MCGIIGGVTQRDIVPILLEGLQRLEYRGYDSAGLAVISKGQQLDCRRSVGKVNHLRELVGRQPVYGTVGIAHTRWATHGKPCETNAHPHTSANDVAIVHNGIIENHAEQRKHLQTAGYQFTSDTDTEVAAHLLHNYLTQGQDLLLAVQQLAQNLEGAFSLGIITTQQPKRLFGIRKGSPLVIGIGIGENFIASDPLALLPVTQRFIYLEEGDIADVGEEQVLIYDKHGQLVERPIQTSTLQQQSTERGNYRHYMLKEIFEQPQAISATLQGRIGKEKVLAEAFGVKAANVFDKIKGVHIVACGTSYYAGLLGRYWLEELAGIPCMVDVASEYRYRSKVVPPGTLLVTISQSGETADTLGALQAANQENYLASLTFCNVASSSLVRQSDLALLTQAGVEIGVASTKAFTTQLVSLLIFAVALAQRQAKWQPQQEKELVEYLHNLPAYIEAVLALDEEIKTLAKHFSAKQHALFLGRGMLYPVALEGALKLKELSYIHAEAYPAGELKHGPLALVDQDMPIIALALKDPLLEKLKSNLSEVQARGGELFIFADKAAGLVSAPGMHVVQLPSLPNILAPIFYTIPLQLLAYHVAVGKGTDVDQPRNLAKSVTVE